MADGPSNSAVRLCIFCRCIEPTSKSCPRLKDPGDPAENTPMNSLEFVTPFSTEDAVLLKTLQMQPSSLCQRCSEYNIINVFKEASPLDAVQQAALSNIEYSEYRQRLARYEMPLALLSSLHLTPSCQLCRLIYRILPRKSLDPEDRTSRIKPFRSYERWTGWEAIP
jgi:hypothetical protein